MQLSINSPSVSTFGFSVKFDLLNRRIIFDTTALTIYQGAGASAVAGVAFSVIDQDGVILSTIDFTAPQLTSLQTNKIYNLDLSSYFYNFLFQTYSIQGAIKDSNGIIYTTPVVYKTVCQPTEFTNSGYVNGTFQILSDCVNNILTVKELTPFVYDSLAPISSPVASGTLNYPTGSIAAVSFANTPFSNNVIYNGSYVINNTTIAEYFLGDDVYVDVAYVTSQEFDITCSNKLSDILPCLVTLQSTYQKHGEDNLGKAAYQQLQDIAPFLMIASQKEKNGMDATSEVDYIRKTLNCDCGSTSLGQNQATPTNPSVNSIILVGAGGTTIPTASITGNTKTFTIATQNYSITKSNPSDLAFTISVDTSVAFTTKYVISFNYAVMAASILAAIGADAGMTATLQSLVNSGISLLGLNGSCIINLSQVSYSASQPFNNSTLVTNIVINGTNYAAPSNTFANNATAVQTWLNSLTLGTFSANINGSTLTILSINNTNVVSNISFGSPASTVQFQTTNATLVQVLQAIINYLCTLSTLQVTLTQQLSLSQFDYSGNLFQLQYAANTSLAGYNLAISQTINNLAARINTLTGITCNTLKAIFQDAPTSLWQTSDRLYGTLNNQCASLTEQQIANLVFKAAVKYPDVLANFCAINCSTPATCPDISNINLSMVGQNIAVYGVTWGTPTQAAQTVSVKYRVHGNIAWLIGTNNLLIQPNGNVSSNPPYLIAGLTAGQTYDVQVINNCGGIGFVSQITVPSSSVYSASYRRDNVIYNICGDAAVTLYSGSPFGTGVTMYTNIGLTTPLTGFTYIADVTGAIYNINTSTGVVGANTGQNCTNGVAGSYILGNNSGTICNNSIVTLYTSGAFGVSSVLYTDAALSNPQTGYAYVVQVSNSHIFNLNTSNGTVGADTGLSCNSNTVTIASSLGGMQIASVSGISGFAGTGFPMNPGGSSVGTHNTFTGSISVVLTGTPAINPSNLTLRVNGVLIQCMNVTAAGTFVFNSYSFASTDVIRVDGNLGSC